MSALESLRAEFPVCESQVFLNHAGVSPTSLSAAQAVADFMQSMAHLGRPSFDDWESLADDCRRRFGQLIGCEPGEVAFVRNTSHGLSLVARGLNWRPGDRVAVATDIEYPSNVYPWVDLMRRGVVALDNIRTDPDGTVTPDAARNALRPRTRVLAVSSAQYASGAVTDLAALGNLCRRNDTLLVVDGIQTVGALPINVKEAGIHVLSADSHKWMLGMMGIGAVFVDSSLAPHIHPPLIGWRSTTDAFNFDRAHLELRGDAGRFEEGSLAYPLIAGFGAALELLENAGVGAIAKHLDTLVARLADRLGALGCELAPSLGHRRHILAFSHPALDGEELGAALADDGIVVSLRRGRIRASPHLYNTAQEMDRVARAVQARIPKGSPMTARPPAPTG